ncbi:MAG: DivIVA domain-containing protein [Ignavibacteria bacterium]|nr:DivIVA domain-containing protein [Ignavibacteria bacterium]MCC7157935.1 DivIVA domain-containing protein [Ignavibacteria bacterium]
MKLSAIDIKKQVFKKSMRGYDVGEVEAYLDTVGNAVENLFRDIEQLREQVAKLEEEKEDLTSEIQVYRENEKTFQKAIVKSQDMAEDVVENAKKRAELIIKEAEILSSKTKVQAQEDFFSLKQELEELRHRNENIIDDIKNYLLEKLNSIEDYQKNRKIYKMDSTEHNMQIEHVKEEEQQVPPNTFGMNMGGNMGGMNIGIDESK